MHNPLTEMFMEIFERCGALGFVWPWIVCSVSSNGSVLAVRMREDTPEEVLAEHYEGAGFRLPMTVIVVDQRNEAARVVIEVSGERTWN